MGECLIVRRGGESYELPVLSASLPADVSLVEAAGASASFSIQIQTPGRPAEYAFQWYLDGAAIPGATGLSCTVGGLSSAGSHTVYCRVTSKAGSVSSRAAALTVLSAVPSYTYTGTAQLSREGGYNWNLRFLTSGTLTFTQLGNAGSLDVFLVGGGGGGGSADCGGGGGGGYTLTGSYSPSAHTTYAIVVGAGGAGGVNGVNNGLGGTGGTSSAFGGSLAAAGGAGGANHGDGGAGGSGGGASTGYGVKYGERGAGGSDGSRGQHGSWYGGAGQGTTTRAFGEAGGTLYAGGGGGAWSQNDPAPGGGGLGATDGRSGGAGGTNLGGGGGGSVVGNGGAGGSGIVVIRNHR